MSREINNSATSGFIMVVSLAEAKMDRYKSPMPPPCKTREYTALRLRSIHPKTSRRMPARAALTMRISMVNMPRAVM